MKPSVLFLCTGNSARSQMGEAFLRKYAGEHFQVYSAGLVPKEINPLTTEVMHEIGIDLSAHSSKSVKAFLGKEFIHILITVCDDAEKNCPTVWPGVNQRLHWSFEDPAAFEGTHAAKLEKFREIRDQIDGRIQAWLAEQGYPNGNTVSP